MNTVIKVENLSKKYIIGHQKKESYTALRDVLSNGAKNLVRRFRPFTINLSPFTNSSQEEFWALKDVSFEIKQGDRVGIIGRNGAGKSTLLKILSRITEPTSGKISIKGRVSSLLEVGTGFHPELTGRENIFLNGAVLGMPRSVIKKKFDEIVAFAEVEKFLDTPVKHYSSGMYVRLAFAVAAHLEPEILIVDEVLAVGDAQFQKKCLGKMEEVGKQGRTILFVSHNMGMITSLCEKAILLESGQVVKTGSASEIVLHYYTAGHSSPAFVDFTKGNKRIGDNYAELLGGYIHSKRGEVSSEIDMREPVTVGVHYRILKTRTFESLYPYPSFHFFSADGTCAFYSSIPNSQTIDPAIGEYTAECVIPGYFLNTGTYFVGFGFSDCESGVNTHFYEPNAVCFHVVETIEETLVESRNGFSGVIPGIVRPKLEWKVKKKEQSFAG